MIIAQSIYIPASFFSLPLAVGIAIGIFAIFATFLASLIFRYFNEVYGSTIAKITFIMTLIAIFGLFIDLAVILLGIIFLPLIFVGLILLLLTLPALIVYYLLWGVTFIYVSENTVNPSLMRTGGIMFLVGWIIGLGGMFAIVNAIAQTISIIGLILVTIVLFTEESGA